MADPLRDRRIFRFLAAALSGVLLAFSFPGVSWGWLAFIALIPLIVAVTRAGRRREAFLLGWLGYTVAWLINLPWVTIVMSRYGGLPKSVGIALFIALSVWLGLYGGIFALIVRSLRLRAAILPWLLVPATWIALEYARSYVLLGSPWHLIGGALIDLPPLVQPARWLGPYGLGFLVVLISTSIAWIVSAGDTWRRRIAVGATVVGFLAVWIATGSILLSQQAAQMRSERQFTAAMLQPNITQEMRWDDRNLSELFQRMARMTEEGFEARADVVIWPESTLPLEFFGDAGFRGYVEATSRAHKGDIILGSVARDAAAPERLWNAAYLVSRGSTTGRYDKLRLVPFGEYVPLRKMLFFAEKLVRQVGEFQFGTNEFPLIGKFKYGPAICYEVVYPRIAATQVANGAEVLVTITNDAWFGRSAAPRQHLNQARLRAVETDRYFLRAATTGISALIDPVGRIVQELDMEQQGIVVGTFSPRQSRTAYVRFGDWPAWFSIAAVIIFLGLKFSRSRS
jgi:apolipoprotein N-acyltransferase